MSRVTTTAVLSVLILLILPFIESLDVRATNEEVLAAGPPPGRPGDFKNPEELRDYLKALNDYIAIAGRPRFGRSNVRRSSFNGRYMPISGTDLILGNDQKSIYADFPRVNPSRNFAEEQTRSC